MLCPGSAGWKSLHYYNTMRLMHVLHLLLVLLVTAPAVQGRKLSGAQCPDVAACLADSANWEMQDGGDGALLARFMC